MCVKLGRLRNTYIEEADDDIVQNEPVVVGSSFDVMRASTSHAGPYEPPSRSSCLLPNELVYVFLNATYEFKSLICDVRQVNHFCAPNSIVGSVIIANWCEMEGVGVQFAYLEIPPLTANMTMTLSAERYHGSCI